MHKFYIVVRYLAGGVVVWHGPCALGEDVLPSSTAGPACSTPHRIVGCAPIARPHACPVLPHRTILALDAMHSVVLGRAVAAALHVVPRRARGLAGGAFGRGGVRAVLGDVLPCWARECALDPGLLQKMIKH